MKISKQNLLASLALPLRIVGGKRASSGLVLIEANFGQFIIKASIADQYCERIAECDGDLPPICVNANTLHSAAMFASDLIELRVDESKLLFKSGSKQHKISMAPSENWQGLAPATALIVTPADVLARGIRHSKFCAPETSDRYVLKSVHVKTTANQLLCESGCGTEFSIFNAPAICSEFEFLIPADFKDTVAETLEIPGAEVLLSESNITIRHQNGCYTCKLLDGVYLNTSKLANPVVDEIGMIARNDWIEIFRCIKLMRGANETLLVNTRVEFSAKSCLIETSGDNPSSETVEGNFKPAVIHINALPFLDCLSAFPDGATLKLEVCKEFNGVSLSDGDLRILTCQLRGEKG